MKTEEILAQLRKAENPQAKAALIAESVISDLPLAIATAARRCAVLHWFTPTLVEALTPEGVEADPEEVVGTITKLPFVEAIPWGYAYHELTRAGLLKHYQSAQREVITNACRLATPVLLDRWDKDRYALEALYCLAIIGPAEDVTKRLDDLLLRIGERQDWEHYGTVFAMIAEAESLPFVDPLPPSAPHRIARGIAYAKLDEYERAIQDFAHAIQLDPQSGRPWNGLGNVYYRQGRHDAAIDAYQHAIQLDPQNPYPWNGLGNIYRERGLYDAAIDAYQHAIQLDPQDAAPWNGLGSMYRKRGRYDAAIDAYQRAIQIDPQHPYAWNGMGNIYREQGRHDVAIDAYQHAIQLDPQYASPWNNLGNVYYQQGQHDLAIDAYQHAIQIDPQYAYAYNNLAGVFVELGQLKQAIPLYEKRIKLEPDTALTAHVALAVIAQHQGNDTAAQIHFAAALDISDTAQQQRLQTPAGLLENKALALLGLGQTDDAIATLKQALAQRLPSDIIDFTFYDLLASAPNAPAGLDQMRRLLEQAINESSSESA